MNTFWVLVAVNLVWMLVNTILGKHAFDPYPFQFILFLGNLCQLWWLPVLSVGQNLQLREDRKRQEEMDQILRNQVITMSAIRSLLERDVALGQSAEDRLKAIQHEIAD